MNPTYLINKETPQIFNIPTGSSLASIGNAFEILMISALVALVLYNYGMAAVKAFSLSSSFGTLNNAKDYKKYFATGSIGLILTVFFISFFMMVDKNTFNLTFLNTMFSVKNSASASPTLTPNATTIGSGGVVGGNKCSNAEFLKTSLQSGQGVCVSTSCPSFCNFDTSISTLVIKESESAGVSYKVILALICRESTGNVKAVHQNANGAGYDCGLMQINKSSCTPDIFDPTTNIRAGIALYKQKLADTSSYSYAGVSRESMAFAAYNCCETEGSPNKKSSDCNTTTGFPQDLPRWGCPINPGNTATNMCFVKNYACEVEACSKKY